MTANYAKLDRVGSLDAGFQQILPVPNFGKFHNIVTELHKEFKISEVNCIGQGKCLALNLFLS